MPEQIYGLTKSQLERIVAGLKRLEAMPRGQGSGASNYRPSGYNVAKFKLQEDLTDGGEAAAKFWYQSTEGDEVQIQPFGVGGTVPEGDIIAAFWWDEKWHFLAAEACPGAGE
jgi:hypothetical protein